MLPVPNSVRQLVRRARLEQGLQRKAERYSYDRSFAPYVVPDGVALGSQDFPDARWFGLMLRSQTRAALAVVATQVQHRAGQWLRPGGLDGALDRFLGSVQEKAQGRIPSGGDAEFAYLRFAGTNPLLIERVRGVDEVPSRLRLDAEILQRLLGAKITLEGLIAREDLFILRYDALTVSGPDDLQPGRYVAPAVALLCHAPEMSATYPVVPLAIECSLGGPGSETGVFTPLDGAAWHHARRLVSVADVNASELVVHLARAHFMTVPFAIALRRKVPKGHPLHTFLLPHLRFNLFVERMAWVQGVRKRSGDLVRSLAGSPLWCQRVAKTLHRDLSFREQHFERDLEARGLAQHPVDYPYRDDGRLLWKAIRRFTAGYVERVWESDEAVANDSALQEFIREAARPDGGNVRELLEGDRLVTRAELTEILTQVLFVAGPLHALAHYASAAQLQHVAENPSWLTANPLSRAEDAIPGALGGIAQYHRVVSTNIRYDRMGDFSRYPLGRQAEFQDLIGQYQADLQAAERTISERNARRPAPFIHFLPSRISNGITV